MAGRVWLSHAQIPRAARRHGGVVQPGCAPRAMAPISWRGDEPLTLCEPCLPRPDTFGCHTLEPTRSTCSLQYEGGALTVRCRSQRTRVLGPAPRSLTHRPGLAGHVAATLTAHAAPAARRALDAAARPPRGMAKAQAALPWHVARARCPIFYLLGVYRPHVRYPLARCGMKLPYCRRFYLTASTFLSLRPRPESRTPRVQRAAQPPCGQAVTGT